MILSAHSMVGEVAGPLLPAAAAESEGRRGEVSSAAAPPCGAGPGMPARMSPAECRPCRPAPAPGSPALSPQSLTGPLPDVSALAQLQALQLQNNQLSGGLPALPATMRSLNVEYNKLRWALLCVELAFGFW